MFKTYRRLSVHKVKLKYPILYAFNYPLTYYSAYGFKPVSHIKRTLSDSNTEAIMMPNLVNNSSTIESRSQKFMEQFQTLINNSDDEKFHIVAHSFAGFDIRAMIHFYDLHDKVFSVSTLSTPHRGLTLLDNIINHPDARPYLVDALRPVGLTDFNAKEFTKDTMRELNEIMTPYETYHKLSYGSRTSIANMNNQLKYPASAIMGGDPLYESDGITMPEDTEWGYTHGDDGLVGDEGFLKGEAAGVGYHFVFETDHYDIGGLSPNFDVRNIHNAVLDNIKLAEAKDDQELEKEYGYIQHQSM